MTKKKRQTSRKSSKMAKHPFEGMPDFDSAMRTLAAPKPEKGGKKKKAKRRLK